MLSGNRNFEGRINPLCRANYLASPPLVVAYALAGRMDFDIVNEPLGQDKSGQPVFLRDIWPTPQEVESTMRRSVTSEMFRKEYADVFTGDEHWRALPIPEGDLYAWDAKSTYIKNPPYFEGMPLRPAALADLRGLRALAVLGDSITTDHISPAGSIPADSPAGKYLIVHGVQPKDFNSYGARRGNHEVMMRGTFANIRLRNHLAPGTEGGWTDPPAKRRKSYDLRRGDEISRRASAADGASPGKNTARALRATGPPRERSCSASAPCWRKASSASTAATSSAWGFCRSNFCRVKIRNRSALPGLKCSTFEGLAQEFEPRKKMKVIARAIQTAKKDVHRASRESTRPSRSPTTSTAESCNTSLRQML